MGASGLTGGCQCGAVRFRVSGEPEEANICHCRMCQKASGQPFMAFARVPAALFAMTKGALAVFHSSDVVERGFCSACGTPLTYRNTDGDRISFAICALDDPATVAPTQQLAAEQAVPWLKAGLAAENVSLDAWFKDKPLPGFASRQHPDHD
jgi:hypothetical protein